MDKKKEAAPGDGIRSLKSTMLFRAVNYELYIKPNKVIMIFGVVAMLSCTGYLIYMRSKLEGMNYYPAIETDGTVSLKKKASKWLD